MTAKTQTTDTARKPGEIVSYPVTASAAKIWKGAPVFTDSDGFAYSNDGTTNTIANGDMFVGWADDTVDNSAGGDGDLEIKVWAEWTVVVPIAATAAQTNVGLPVYINNASDNSLVTLTSDTWQPQVTAWRIIGIESATRVRITTSGVYTVAAAGA